MKIIAAFVFGAMFFTAPALAQFQLDKLQSLVPSIDSIKRGSGETFEVEPPKQQYAPGPANQWDRRPVRQIDPNSPLGQGIERYKATNEEPTPQREGNPGTVDLKDIPKAKNTRQERAEREAAKNNNKKD